MTKPGRGQVSPRVRRAAGVEWVGGRFSMPYVLEDEPHRPELGVWLELPSGLVLGHSVVAQNEAESAIVSALKGAMVRQAAGAARGPARLRVANAALAAEARAHLGDRFVIDVGPTPELDELYELLLASMPAGEDYATYLQGGRVPERAIARMFRAAEVLYRCAPWRVASDSEVLRADIPALGVEGACVSIIGALGESMGLIIFPSLLAFERFGAMAGQAERGTRALDLGDQVLSLDFWRTRDLPAGLRREAASHGWPTASPNSFPVVACRDRDGMSRPVTERDVQIATECAFAVASFFARHPAAFGGRLREAVSESMTTGDDGVTVRLRAPYDAYDPIEPLTLPPKVASRPLAGPPSSAGAGGKVGSNDPCPCGSRKKYKKCCLQEREGARQAERQRANVHELDERLVWHLREFALDRVWSGLGGRDEALREGRRRRGTDARPAFRALVGLRGLHRRRAPGRRLPGGAGPDALARGAGVAPRAAARVAQRLGGHVVPTGGRRDRAGSVLRGAPERA